MASSRKRSRTAYSLLTSGTTFDNTFVFEGEVLTRYVLECADTTSNRTRTLSIIDANSITVFTGAAHADNANYSIPCDVELDGTYTFRLTLSGTTGDAGTITDYLTLFSR